MGLCVAMIAFVRLPSLKVSCLLLSGLLIYDVFWVSVAPLLREEEGAERTQMDGWIALPAIK